MSEEAVGVYHNKLIAFLFNLLLPGNIAVFPSKLEEAIKETLSNKYGQDWFSSNEVRCRLMDSIDFLRENFCPEAYVSDVPYAYSIYYLPQNFHKIQLMLLELLADDLLPLRRHFKVLDIGMGVGTTVFAVMDFLEVLYMASPVFSVQFPIEKVTIQGVEKSKENVKVFNEIFSRYSNKIESEVLSFLNLRDPLCIDVTNEDFFEKMGEEEFDIIVVSNIINELSRQGLDLTAWLGKLRRYLKEKTGLLLLVEPASKEETLTLRTLSKRLVQMGVYKIVRPCGEMTGNHPMPGCERCWSFRREVMQMPNISKIMVKRELDEKLDLLNKSICWRDDSFHVSGLDDEALNQIADKVKRKMERIVKERQDWLNKLLSSSDWDSDFLKKIKKVIIRKEVNTALSKIREVQNKLRWRLDSITKMKIRCSTCNNECEVDWDKEKSWCRSCGKEVNLPQTWKKKVYRLREKIQQYCFAEEVLLESQLLDKERIGNIKKDIIYKCLVEDYFFTQSYFPVLKWSYVVMKLGDGRSMRTFLQRYGLFSSSIKRANAEYRVVSHTLYAPELEGKNTLIYKICGGKTGERYNLFLRFAEDVIPSRIRFGDVLEIDNISPTKISDKEPYLRCFGSDFDFKSSMEIYVGTYKDLECIKVKRANYRDRDYRDCFKSYYGATLDLYKKLLDSGGIEDEIVKRPDIKEKVKRMEYFLNRIFPNITYFKKGQFYSIAKILSGENILSIMATGGGKSLCYQLSAFMLPGVTIVISPLKSLIQDQIRGIENAGYGSQVTFIDGDISLVEKEYRLRMMLKGYYKIVYLTPEQLGDYIVLTYLKETFVNTLVIDEAHCVSQWGHDFRPAYLTIRDRHKLYMDGASIACFTATASEKVVRDLKREYDLRDEDILRTSFLRKELNIKVREVKSDEERIEKIIELLVENSSSDVLIFTPFTVRHKYSTNLVYYAEDLCKVLKDRGFKVGAYHSNFESWQKKYYRNRKNIGTSSLRRRFEEIKRESMERFISSDDNKGINVLCATKAFGMGIDKPDITVIIHTNLPSSLEDYYQQIGRAARGFGVTADCILLVGKLPKKGDCDRDCLKCNKREFDCCRQAFLIQKEKGRIDGEVDESLLTALLDCSSDIHYDGNRYKYIRIYRNGDEDYCYWNNKRYSTKKVESLLNFLNRHNQDLKRPILERHVLETRMVFDNPINFEVIKDKLPLKEQRRILSRIEKLLSGKTEIDLLEVAQKVNIPVCILHNLLSFVLGQHSKQQEQKVMELKVPLSLELTLGDIKEIKKKMDDRVLERAKALHSFVDWVQNKDVCRKERLINYFLSDEIIDSRYCYGCDVCEAKMKEVGILSNDEVIDRYFLAEHIDKVKVNRYEPYFIDLEREIESLGKTKNYTCDYVHRLHQYVSLLCSPKYESRKERMINHYDHRDELYELSCYVLARYEYNKNGLSANVFEYFYEMKDTILFDFLYRHQDLIDEDDLVLLLELVNLIGELNKKKSEELIYALDRIALILHRIGDEQVTKVARYKIKNSYDDGSAELEFIYNFLEGAFYALRGETGDKFWERCISWTNKKEVIFLIVERIYDPFLREKILYQLKEGEIGRLHHLKKMLCLDVNRSFVFWEECLGKTNNKGEKVLDDIKTILDRSLDSDLLKRVLQFLIKHKVISLKDLSTFNMDIHLICDKCGSKFVLAHELQQLFLQCDEKNIPTVCVRCFLYDKINIYPEHKLDKYWPIFEYFVLSPFFNVDRDLLLKMYLGISYFYADNPNAKGMLESVRQESKDPAIIAKCSEYLDDME